MKYFVLLFICLSMPLLVFSATTDDSPDNESKDGTQVYPLSDDLNMVTTLKYTYGKHSVVTKSVFPQLECDNDINRVNTFNQLINQIILEEIGEFQNKVDHYLVHRRLAKSNGKSDLTIDYDTSAMKNGRSQILSIRFSIQGNIAGLSKPYHYHRVVNYNLETDQTFQLSDLFKPGDNSYLSLISDYTQKILLKRLQNKAFIANGTAPSADNFKNWNIKANGLLITFDEAQVAPSIYGAQSVLVPFAVLKPLAAPDSPIASCFKHRRRCGNNHLLTGGFIDEAINMRYGQFDPIFSQA